jgi:hypothetical protein
MTSPSSSIIWAILVAFAIDEGHDCMPISGVGAQAEPALRIGLDGLERRALRPVALHGEDRHADRHGRRGLGQQHAARDGALGAHELDHRAQTTLLDIGPTQLLRHEHPDVGRKIGGVVDLHPELVGTCPRTDEERSYVQCDLPG